MCRTALLSIGFLSFLCPMACGANWGHWRGPDGNGKASEGNPPVRWSDKTNVKWKVPIPGSGSGSPVVWSNRVFVVTAVATGGKGQQATTVERVEPRRGFSRGQRGPGGGGHPIQELAFQLLCFDRDNGNLEWEQTATVATPHEGTHSTNGFASASPCTDGNHVYAHFGSRGLYCYTMDGELVWKRDDLGKMTTRNSFGEGSSPTLVDGRIIVPWDHEGPSYLFSLDAQTGKTAWKVPRDEPTCWATPLIVEHGGRKQIVMNGQTCARSYDLQSGEELWRCAGQTQRPVACPVAADGLVFVGSGFRGSYLGAFRLSGRGDIAGTKHVVWEIGRDTPDIASLLYSSGRLYFHKEKTGLLSCFDAKTGKPHYQAKRVTGLSRIYASPIAAGGHVYLTGRSGTTVVIEDSPTFKIVATNHVGETVDATPAPVDDELFIRGESHLFCIAE